MSEKELEVFDSNGDIDWNSVSEIFKQVNGEKEPDENHKEQKEYICKKCKKPFYCRNYGGKYPMCSEHRKKD